MIDENDLMQSLGHFKDQRQLEKDYLLNLMLKSISLNGISDKLVFKGGTALSYLYGLDRFSEDLDFIYAPLKQAGANPISGIDSSISDVAKDYSSSYRIRKSKLGIVERDGSGSPIGIRNEFFIEGPLFSKSRLSHKIKVDISLRQDLIGPARAERFVSKYKDIGGFLIRVMSSEEILVEKMCSIIERGIARDLYDSYFILKYRNTKFEKDMFTKKAEMRGYRADAQELIKRIRGFSETAWKEELSYIIAALPDLSEVKNLVIERLK
jgi:hypothetical protein